VSYSTPQDLINRKSPETIAALVSDDGVEASESDLLDNGTDAGIRVQAALDSAAGMIEAAVLRAKRYSTADLAGLTGNSAAFLVMIECEIAMAILFARKPMFQIDNYKAALELQDMYLTQLRKGETIFDVAENADAGTPSYSAPSVVEVQSLGLIRDMARPYYPARRSQSG
jgi:hypothetical protein